MQEYLDIVVAWAGILGPNNYVRAAGLVVVFLLFGKIAELMLSKILAKVVA